MNLQEFINKFAELFFETDISEFKANTKFRTLQEWGSMIGLSVIAMIDEEYDITIKGDDIRASETIEDLFNVIKGYKQ